MTEEELVKLVGEGEEKNYSSKEGMHAPSNRELPLLFNMRLRKLEVPTFKGEENTNEWLLQVERYFIVK